MKNLRIAALTIAVALLAVGLTVPFETVLAGSNHHLNFKSLDVDLPGVTLTKLWASTLKAISWAVTK